MSVCLSLCQLCRRRLSSVAGAASSTSAVKYDGMRTVPATAPHLPSTSGPTSDLLPQFTPSLLDKLFSRSSMKRVPLTEAYPTGLPEPTDQPLPSELQRHTAQRGQSTRLPFDIATCARSV